MAEPNKLSGKNLLTLIPICGGVENPTEHILYEILEIRMAIIVSNHQQGLNWYIEKSKSQI
ncbi:hypothetical protein N9T46_00520 [bacterium]|nr:hypothetical protein [bacterium]